MTHPERAYIVSMLLLFMPILTAGWCLAGEQAGAEFRVLYQMESNKLATFQSCQPKMVVDGRRVYFVYLRSLAKDGASTVRLAVYDGHGLACLDQRQGHITSGCLLRGGRMLYHLFNDYPKKELHLTVYRLREDGAHLAQRKVYSGFVSAGKINAALAEGTIYVADAYGGLWLVDVKTLAPTPIRKVIPDPARPINRQYPHIALDGEWLVLAYTLDRYQFDPWGYFRNLGSNLAGFSVHNLVTGKTRHQTLDDDRVMSGSLVVHGGSLYLVSMSPGLLKIYLIDDHGSARKI